jgi:hypothetical protein
MTKPGLKVPAVLLLINMLTYKQLVYSGSSFFKSKDIFDQAEKNMDKSTYFEKLEELRNIGEISRTRKGEYK